MPQDIKVIKEITVDVAKKNLFQPIVAKQHDTNSRFLKVTICNEGEKIDVPSTASVILNAERADGSPGRFKGTVNSDGTVTVPITSWMLDFDDVVRCSISVIGADEQKLTSTSFSIDVESAEYSDLDITDDENYDILISIINECAEIKKQVEDIKDKLEKVEGVGGGSSSIPVYILNWKDHPTEGEEQANIATIKEIRGLEEGSYLLYLKLADGRLLPVGQIGSYNYTFIDSSDPQGSFPIYEIRYSESKYPGSESTGTYTQFKNDHISSEFDESSWAAPSMIAVAEYVEQKLSEYLAIDSEELL